MTDSRSSTAGVMSDKELQAVSGEDLEMFKGLVVDFYRRPWEESYTLLRAEIRKRLLRKSTNPTYRSMLVGEVDDLVTSVFIRYAKVYGKIRRAGGEIEGFEAMLEDRVKLVYHEALRRYSRLLPDIRPDSHETTEAASPAVLIDRALEEEEERARLNRCLIECLRELPEHVRNIFLEYFDTDAYSPHERVEMRLRLALREANIPVEQATPEQIFRARRNLNTMISKWRTNHLKPCKEKCLKRVASAR